MNRPAKEEGQLQDWTAPVAQLASVAAAQEGLGELKPKRRARRHKPIATDSKIGQDLRLAFKDRSEFKDVDTSVTNGTVRLTGTVGSRWDDLSAVRVARHTAGLRGIEDKLTVTKTLSPETTRHD